MDLIAHLEAFVAVAESRSFTRGAESCGVPQPVVSRRVAALEKHFGGSLLYRTSRRVDVTDLGRTLLPHAADLVARTAHLHELARTKNAVGVVIVGIPPSPDARALVAARRVAAEAGLSLTFSEFPVAERSSLVRLGHLDVALIPCPPDEEELGVRLGAATGTDGIRGRRVHLDQLRRVAGDHGRPRTMHLNPEDDVPWVRDSLRRAAHAAGLRDDQVREDASDTEAVAGALEYGDVVLCTQAWATAHDLRWRTLADVSLRRTYAITTRSHAVKDAIRDALPAFARAAGLSSGSVPDASTPEPL